MSGRKRFVVVGVIAVATLLILAAVFWLPLPWQLAHHATVPVVQIKIAIKDHTDLWQEEYKGTVEGSGTHWLSHKGPNVPIGREGGLWYDGTLVATESSGNFLKDYRLSSNGGHYAYNLDVRRTDTDATTISKIIVDGKEIVRGKGLVLYEITDIGDVYYTCLECGKNIDGFFRNHEKLVDKQDSTYWGGPDNRQQIQCLFRRDADVEQLTRTLTTTTELEIPACSPNGKYIVKDKPEPLWPEGYKDVLFMNGVKIDEGDIANWVVNDEGKLTYVKSGSPLPGLTSLTINGRGNYIVSSVSDHTSQILYSPSLKNIALVQNGKWWVNGRATNIDQYENVSLGDTAFYVYRF